MNKKLIIALPVFVLVAGLGLAAVFGMPWLEGNGLLGQERLLESRMHAYWQARVAGDVEAMSNYQHPRQRLVMSPGMLITESYDVTNIEVGEEKATATVTIVTHRREATRQMASACTM